MKVFVLEVMNLEKRTDYIYDIYKKEEDAEKNMNELNKLFMLTNQRKFSYYEPYKVK